ncbi:AAA family ATPase [Nonomuraea sp. LP-02]|uniref:AAA family ATPase n=1 Tax=Nonomuraea sp. LP-02 TaxID=3097960 RepID=UPI002E37AD44|nr:AAA family ATPase [Nonomuraea sp. LP-02]MED7929531.1 AAA family ATPase [Nonomuraea sp. LP-02]
MNIHGRDHELHICQTALQHTPLPTALIISGEAGIGKTVLFRAMTALVAASGARVLSTVGIPGVVDFPLTNLIDLLTPAVGDILNVIPATQASALRVALRITEGATQPAEALLASATVNAIRALSHEHLLLAIDDEQWLDADTRKLLSITAVRLAQQPIAWLIAGRTEQIERGIAQVLTHELGASVTWLKVAPLEGSTLTGLILDRFPGTWSPQLLTHIHELSGGNTYTALELARETTAAQGQAGSKVHLPLSITDSLRARLARLTPNTLAVVQAAAVTPRPTRRLLRLVFGEGADTALNEALEADILDIVAPANPVLRFTHPLLRAVSHASLTGARLQRLHARLATAVEDPDVAAGHLAAGAEEPDERTAATVYRAAVRVLDSGAPARAAQLAEAALSLTPDPAHPHAWHRRFLLLDCLETASEFEQARRLAEGWASQVPDSLRGQLTARRGRLQTDFETAADLLEQAMSQLSGDPTQTAQVAVDLAVVAGIHLMRLPQGGAAADRCVKNAERTGDPLAMRRALSVKGFLAGLAGDPKSALILRSGLDLPSLHGMAFPYYSPETRLAMTHTWRGEVERARELHLEVLKAGEQCGSQESANGTRLHLVEVEWRAGRWAQAAQYADIVAHYWRVSGAVQDGQPEYGLALVHAARGQVERARALAVQGLRAAEGQKSMVFAGQCRSVLGQLELSVDDPAAAVGWLEPFARFFHEHEFGEPGLFTFPADLVEGYARVGRIDDAAAELKWLREAAARLDHPWARITGGRAAAALHLATGDPYAAVETLTPALQEARDLGLLLEVGRALLLLGMAERRTRERRSAARTLDEAIHLLGNLGAARWEALARAQRALLAHLADDLLTPAEQRMAELVAKGLTNAEIASALHVTLKTVEGTLTRVYRKLGVRGRVELTRRTILPSRGGDPP